MYHGYHRSIVIKRNQLQVDQNYQRTMAGWWGQPTPPKNLSSSVGMMEPWDESNHKVELDDPLVAVVKIDPKRVMKRMES